MSFNPDKFEAAKFKPRTKEVEVKALSDFFDDEKCLWVVRGLTSNELHKAIEAQKTHSNMAKAIQAIEENADMVKSVRNLIGLTDNVPGEVAKRLEMLTAGSHEPKIGLNIAVKIAENFPVEFMQLTNVITELTGLGSDLVKRKAASKVTQD